MPLFRKRKAPWMKEHERRVATFPEGIRTAYSHSSGHRAEVMASETCGCFHCLEVFPPSEITDWVDENDLGEGQTAFCPRCGIDSIIGDRSGFSVSRKFLKEMKAFWF